MTYIIAYDITCDKIRTKLAHYLEKKGLRIQKSLFLVEATPNKIKHIRRDIETIRKDDGIVHIFRLCKNCTKNSKVIGEELPELFFFVE